MVGVPKSKRCAFCKSRKTKCDEKWPTCGACSRAGKICSGARNTFKFVVNGSHNEMAVGYTTDEDRVRRTPTPGASQSRRASPAGLTVVNVVHVPVGGFDSTQLAFSAPYTPISPSMPWKSSDTVIAKVVACLEAAPGTGSDLRIVGAFLPLIPQHLGKAHVVLEHALELIMCAWANTRRGLPPTSWLDLRTYNRAIRSLTDALYDANTEELTYTMAAQCILQKTEVLYDFSRGSNQENHAAGLIAVYKGKGPDPGMSDVELHIFFESLFHMLQEEVRLGRTSDFNTPEWTMALRHAIKASSLGYIFRQTYLLWTEGTVWPVTVHLVRSLQQNPSDMSIATRLREKALSWADFLQRQDETVLDHLFKNGDITEVTIDTHPDIMYTCYEFTNYPTAKLFTSHAMFSIIACRALQQANQALSYSDPSVEEQARVFSRRIWKSHPWAKDKTPMSIDFTGPLCFSFESGNEQEQIYCRQSLDEMESFRQPPPIGVWSEETILANAQAYTGRLPFIKTQDSKVEYERIGCRS
ncbi:hypothetical protein F5Y16DRAFT_417582 [Xylariaceae sp. FL0255]|nr:hypothetical protein F5Y16DRAFT_417582 [Xylariaceae sp. FL0255]